VAWSFGAVDVPSWVTRLVRVQAPEGPIREFLAVVVVIVAAPVVFERVRVPGIIGLLVGGLLIGPHGLGIVPGSDTVIGALGELGLLYLMFLAGLELDLEVFRRYRRGALVFALLTFSLPMVFGFGTVPVWPQASGDTLHQTATLDGVGKVTIRYSVYKVQSTTTTSAPTPTTTAPPTTAPPTTMATTTTMPPASPALPSSREAIRA